MIENRRGDVITKAAAARFDQPIADYEQLRADAVSSRQATTSEDLLVPRIPKPHSPRP